MNRLTEPIPLATGEKTTVSNSLANAFADDPLYRRIFPNTDERFQVLRSLFGAVVGYSHRYGHVYTTPSVEGAACWLTPGNTKVTFWRMLRTGLAFQRVMTRLPAAARQQLLDALAFSDEIHHRLLPGHHMDDHWYLWALGVSPDCQGRGIGSALIQPALTQADHDGALCYLETMNERNVSFYLRWGFEVKAEEVVPGVQVALWSMIREPRP
jgi:ribosomal protein S18 acetylase RimI-like enzyme